MSEKDPRKSHRGPGDRSEDEEPHHALASPADSPDETEWPDPYDERGDPRGPGNRPPPGAQSTSTD
jgi:hypothetical protein